MRVHPANEDVALREEEGQRFVSASTRGAGPGSHALLVEALARAVG